METPWETGSLPSSRPSLEDVPLSLSSDPNFAPPENLIHGTTLEQWAAIQHEGIYPVAGSSVNLWTTTERMPSNQVHVYLDVELCFRDFKIFRAGDAMFKCYGRSSTGIIPTMYFLRAINPATGGTIWEKPPPDTSPLGPTPFRFQSQLPTHERISQPGPGPNSPLPQPNFWTRIGQKITPIHPNGAQFGIPSTTQTQNGLKARGSTLDVFILEKLW